MIDMKDNIRIMNGDKRVLVKAKMNAVKRWMSAKYSNVRWKILIVLNGFKF
jgi:hypothetical protein